MTQSAYANMRWNYSRELFSVYDIVTLLTGITDHPQAKAAEKLLADCLEIVYPLLKARNLKGTVTPSIAYGLRVLDANSLHWGRNPLRQSTVAYRFRPKPDKKPAQIWVISL